MSNVNLLIVYYRSTGTNYQLASAAKNAAEAAGANVRLRKVTKLAPDAAIDSNPAWRATVDATSSLYNIFYHWGCIIVPPGYTDQAVFANGGNPYGVSTNSVVDGEEVPEMAKAAVAHLTNRVIQIGALVTAG